MAVPQRPDEPYSEGPSPEKLTTKRLREQSQLEFELEFLGGILERDPLNADVLKAHAANLSAKGIYNRALQADLQLVRLRPEQPIVWYNLACSYALLGMADKAFAALERSIRLGYAYFEHIKRDPDLKSLRSDPRFDQIFDRR